ncbi:MAG: T9SS type A sorting domain-containing protein [Bacteroidota bacterium]
MNSILFDFLRKTVFLLFILLSLFNDCFGQVLNGHYGIGNQLQADTFPGYSIITGSLTMSGSDLSHVDSLYSLTEIHGDLYIFGADSLSNLDGLSNLTLIGGDLLLIAGANSSLQNLTNIDGLANVSSIGGKIQFDHPDGLLNVDGLIGLTNIPEDFFITGLAIENLDGLANLDSIGGLLSISACPNLSNVDGLADLTYVGGTFRMYEETNIPANTILTNLDSLSNLTYVGNSLSISGFLSLSNVDGLSGLTHLQEGFGISSPALQNVDGLINVDSIEGGFGLTDCSSLANVDGLSSLKYVGGQFRISGTNFLTNLNGLSNLKTIGDRIFMLDNASLADISGFSSLTTIGSSPATPGTSIMSVRIQDHPLLTSLAGLDNLQKIAGGIAIVQNPLLTQFDGFSQVDSLYGGLTVLSNHSLQNLHGLRNIHYYGSSSMNVKQNSSLNDCCGLYNYVNSVGLTEASQKISSNGNGCDAASILANGPCGIDDEYFLSGYAYYDINLNCQNDSIDLAGQYEIIQAMPGPFYGSTDEFGNYLLSIDTGTYSISVFPSRPGWQSCTINIQATVLPSDSTVFVQDLGIHRDSCPDLSLELSGFWSRRCFPGTISLDYCNWGINPTHQTKLFVRLPQYLTLLSSSLPFSYLPDSTLEIDIGTVSSLNCGSVQLHTEVSCSSIELLEIVQCVDAWMDSPDLCPPSAPNWSGASLMIQQACRDSLNRFSVINIGQADMADSSQYRIFADDALVQTGNLSLQQGDTLLFDIQSTGQMFRLEVEQEEHHPQNSMVSAALEGCTVSLDSLSSKGFLDNYPLPIRHPGPTFAAMCRPIIGAYDPNDKQVVPQGFGNNGLTRPGSRLQYLVRFQNTGNDTAFNIFIIDTLSANLDLRTLEIEATSHPYRLEVNGYEQAVLHFYFDNILLPDSNINEAASHGFIQFSIDHHSSAPLDTEIKNFADIYFDFNLPIRTNHTLNTLSLFQEEAIGSLSDISLTYLPNKSTSLDNFVSSNIRVFPNPAKNFLKISGKAIKDHSLEIEWINIQGKVVRRSRQSVSFGPFEYEENLENFTPGLYFLRINGETSFKIMIQR